MRFAETDYRIYRNLAKRLCCECYHLDGVANKHVKAGVYTREEIHQALIDLVDELNIIENRPNFTIGEVRDAFYKYIKLEKTCDKRYIAYIHKKIWYWGR